MHDDGNGLVAAGEQSIVRKNTEHPYGSEYANPPGKLLATHLAAREMSQAECARRCGRSPKLISEIVSGKAPIQPETALQLERVLGLRSNVWLGIENDYRLRLVRKAEAERAKANRDWLESFPLPALIERGVLEERTSLAESLDDLLAFFGVGSIAAWEAWHSAVLARMRHAAGPGVDQKALATWLRLGDLAADEIRCDEYDGRAFREALRVLSRSIRRSRDGSLDRAGELCQAAGVALVLIDPLPGAPVTGAARWITPRKALVQLAGRNPRGDRFWLGLFHAAGHLLLHSKRCVFVESDGLRRESGGATGDTGEIEAQAHAWAAKLLSVT
ncbi:MAG: XRE family transcriptional regulator [Gemmatimonadota bacterium]|nr:XRE family transcriptional regulator [Gemmatimonadota bacterium]MDE2870863.1 XRE family transcriptional regulator [Gemmatimonadota bacterium]